MVSPNNNILVNNSSSKAYADIGKIADVSQVRTSTLWVRVNLKRKPQMWLPGPFEKSTPGKCSRLRVSAIRVRNAETVKQNVKQNTFPYSRYRRRSYIYVRSVSMISKTFCLNFAQSFFFLILVYERIVEERCNSNMLLELLGSYKLIG